MLQEHINEKTMLCDKIKELGDEFQRKSIDFQQFERSMDRSSMKNYWQAEMENHEEPLEPTLA